MKTKCPCNEAHDRRRIVLTGGPGAGKTAVLELLRHSLCDHVVILPESASMIFGGGFPRHTSVGALAAAQRAIFHVQVELENAVEANGARIMLCDRGAVDGSAYWPGPEDFWKSVAATRQKTLARYDAVIHLRVPEANSGYGHQNPLRIESQAEAREIDDRIMRAWDGHPRRYVVNPTDNFMEKATRALDILRDELPACCQKHRQIAASAGVTQTLLAVR